MNTNENAVAAIFPNEAAAIAAITSLHSWDVKMEHIDLGAIGTVKLDKGKPKVSVRQGGYFSSALKLDKDEIELIGQHLEGDQVCVVVRSDDYEISLVRTQLEKAGGNVAGVVELFDAGEDDIGDVAGFDSINERIFYDEMDTVLDVSTVNILGFN